LATFLEGYCYAPPTFGLSCFVSRLLFSLGGTLTMESGSTHFAAWSRGAPTFVNGSFSLNEVANA
jgi:hypothetical protein